MLETFARLGYASKAVIYAVVGGLAIAAAANRGGRITDTSGALRVVLSQPFGRVVLVVLAAGLLGYAVWRLLDAVMDPDRSGTSPAGLVARIGNAVRGLIYGALGLEAIRLLRGLRGSSGNEAELWTARIMDLPLGDWAIGLTGLVIAGYGASEVVHSFKGKRDPLLDYSALAPGVRTAARRISRFGVGSRGVILGALGFFLVRAAVEHDPSQASGTRESIVSLAGMVEGRWVLAAIAAGLLAYAVDQALHAGCRRIREVM